jgi:hypothetical protein
MVGSIMASHRQDRSDRRNVGLLSLLIRRIAAVILQADSWPGLAVHYMS